MNDTSWLKEAITKLVGWIEKNNYASYDNYDFSSSKFGIWSKQLYHSHRFLGLPIAGVLYLIDVYAPALRKLFAHEAISAEAMPYFALGYFRLYETEQDERYLAKALNCLQWLTKNHTKTKSGLGWGLHFDWQSIRLLPRGTPCITVTSHGTAAFLKGYEITKKQEYLDVAIGTAEFALHDLNQHVADNGAVAVSYTPLCHSVVINANTYCAKILYDVWSMTGNETYIKFANKVIKYVLAEQQENGAWFYFGKNQFRSNFIDNLHTCFVLENLYEIYLRSKEKKVLDSIVKGFTFFRDRFVNEDYSVKHFYFYPLSHGIKIDIRSCAETIYCCALLSDLFPEALELSKEVTDWTIENMQSPNGYFYFRIYRTHKHKMPYMRWGQAPMFNALTYLFRKTGSK